MASFLLPAARTVKLAGIRNQASGDRERLFLIPDAGFLAPGIGRSGGPASDERFQCPTAVRQSRKPFARGLIPIGLSHFSVGFLIWLGRVGRESKEVQTMPGFEPTQPPAARAEQLHNHAEVRHGPTGTIELFFDPDLTRFSSVERRHG
jgi:hypothetical protein